MEGWYTEWENTIKCIPKEFIENVEEENMNNYSKICKKTESTQTNNYRYKFNHLEKMLNSDDENMNTVVFIYARPDHSSPDHEPELNCVKRITDGYDCTAA